MCIDIDLHQEYSIDTPGTLASIDWAVLPLMIKLRTLRFYTGARFDDNSYATCGIALVHNEYVDGEGDLPNGTVCYHQMARDLSTLISKSVDVSFGLDDVEEQLKCYEWEYLEAEYYDGPFPHQCVVGEFLEKALEEFQALRGVDVGFIRACLL